MSKKQKPAASESSVRLKLLKHWQLNVPGDCIRVSRPIGELLVGRGMAKRAGGR